MSKMSFFGFSATFGGKILWKSIMEDTYIKKIHTSQVGGAKLLNLGKKCHFWLFLSPETQSYTILATFNGQTLCKLIIIGTYIKKIMYSQIGGPNCEIPALFGHFCYFFGQIKFFWPFFCRLFL